MQNCTTHDFNKSFRSHVNFLVAQEALILRPFLPSVTLSLFFKEIADICLNTHLFHHMEFWIQKSKLENNFEVGLHFQATTDWHFKCHLLISPFRCTGHCTVHGACTTCGVGAGQQAGQRGRAATVVRG